MCQTPLLVDDAPPALARAVLDASVVVDGVGQIVLANKTWRRFSGVAISGLRFDDELHAVVTHENVANQRFGAAGSAN